MKQRIRQQVDKNAKVMPIKLEISYTEAELKTKHRELCDKRGTLSAFTDSGTSVNNRALYEIDKQITDVEQALRRLNPDVYGQLVRTASFLNSGLINR